MFIKIHKAYRQVVAVCDSDIIGKVFEEGKAVLNLRDNFYRGDEKNSQETIEIIQDLAKEDATFNIAGKEAVKCALEAGIISEEGIKTVQGIPVALVLL